MLVRLVGATAIAVMVLPPAYGNALPGNASRRAGRTSAGDIACVAPVWSWRFTVSAPAISGRV